MIRFCPNCQSERSLSEIFCEGSIQGQPCGWDLSAEAIHPAGWRPQPVLTQEAIAPPASEPPTASAPLCANGHPLQPGDLMCLECGAAPAEGPLPMQAEATPQPAVTETLIDGWRLLRQIASSDGVRERYLAEHAESARQAVLTLYRPGAEPDPAIYDVIRRLPREHVPEILASGRWDERAYEVVEELTGGSLAELGTVLEDREAVRHVVRELGHALHVFNEAGLRHRDLRPASLLVRSHEPLDLVISGFGSARLSEFDLDIVSPLETSRYMAPEAIAGGVAAASDWWSLGMILLEQLTRGACFEGVNANAFLIHVLANGVALPDDLDPQLHLLLRGLLARDRHQRWQWPQVQAWLNGEAVDAPASADSEKDDAEGASIALGARRFRKPTVFALAAAQAEHWAEALDHLLRGAIVTWAEHIGLSPRLLAGLRQVAQHEGLEDDFRLMLALKLLNPEIPLIQRGEIVTPGWLLEHPLEGYRLISGSVPDLLEQLHTESWLSRLKTRAENVRQRALHQHIELAEEQLRIYLLSTSRARLAAQWQERQRLLPDTEHPGLLALAERRVIAEEDLIVLLSANIGQFRAAEAIVEEAAGLARDADVHLFDAETARGLLQHSRQELYRRVDERISGFARSGVPRVDEWAEQFRLERRMPLARVLVLLAIPPEQWLEPQKQQYVSQILDFFEKKVVAAVMRGPLVRMSIGKSTPRIDLNELHSARRPAAALLDHLLQRNARAVSLDPDSFLANPQLEVRLNALSRQSSLYKRDTGIDGLYLGFPFLLNRDPRGTTRTRIVPLLLWPLKLQLEVGSRGQVALAFDGEREEVRLNPALESLLGPEPCKRWRKVADELLGRSALRAADVMDAFGLLATPRARVLEGLPPSSTEVTPYQDQLACAAVLFHVTFMGQAIGEDLRQLKSLPPSGTGLETALRLRENGEPEARESPPELQRYFTVASDPSQEAAVLQARQSPGLLVEGPPGTGKSQTIVNMVADAIGRQRSLLIVCQKHAALEVVHKRLVAEGLGQRIVMLNDVNRDREPVIRNIREQLEALFADAGGTQGWERQRERLAARIEALEGELDRYHQSLHRVDEATGLSYRRLLGELIELEKGSPPLDFPALRQRLAALDIGSLARLEENCAPLVRLWLPARYEGSPLAQLRAFATDQATLQAFADSLRAFGEAENARQKALDEHPASFEVDDPTPYRAWLASQVGTLLNLREEQRQRLAHWLPLFRDAAPGQPSRGDGLLAEAEQIERQLRQLDLERHAPLLSPALAMLEENNLERFQAHARQVLEARTWLARLNPLRLLRRGRLRRFLREHGEADDDSRLAALLGACDLERQWRPLRRQLAALQQSLGLATVATDAGPELTGLAGSASQQLREIQTLARSLAQAPRAEQLDAVILTGEKQRFEALLGDLDAALIRQAARQLSLDKLKVLADWLGDELLEQLHRAIAGNQSNLPALGRLREALPQLVAYQRFRGRAGQLEATDLEFLALLRQRQERLDAIPAEALEATVRRMLNREARLGWKQRLEQDNPELLFSQDEARARVASLAEADVQMRALNRELLGKGIDAARLGSRKQWEDVTRLTGKRSRRLREFIELGAELGLMSLRPVWLMNPDLASRVLPLKAGLFDMVIYDEASQMPVEFALPTLYRGRVTVVSGDEKQMPPTAFFSSRVESDEAELFDGEAPDEDADEEQREAYEDTWNRREIKDCPDLLQLARNALPSTTLQIHYRSAYRELIGFSNASFYGNRLSVPVRHPQANILRIKPLELIQVNGLYQNQSNEREAERVVDYLAELWRQPYAARPSVGVVTFNRKQADLIEERLELRAEQDEAFRAAYSEERERSEDGEDMGVFVKNVENVQGDERDVIVFSSTFGRNGQGSFRRNFGVLGQTGGERRLNVAVTRARRKVVMITSMPIGDISDMLGTQRSPSSPRDYLQGYLEYARALSAGEFAGTGQLLERLHTDRSDQRRQHYQRHDGFSEIVGEYIRSLGWSAAPASEGDAFGLDFAIENPATGLYAIGIECDAPCHPLLERARAREIWRPSVLRRAIPHLHRVSSQGWYHDGDNERARLRAAIEKALAPSAETHPTAAAEASQ
ncbi:AAA domain-containing protein [Pseudomonas aeruginosa]|uniref:AAA domain-containing protein n=1 Tax=Pseudomonas aeruginosa TaxID=287 RepID=UPI000FEEBD79|nr:AAA domain-containing protein [Pseudomonas aeruginosa]MCG0483878.1 AAA domain-containing protein [Pseudomonas aeruginosa]MCU9111482.1 AAA domain-containing protein [Pseudomonas aeruginosa]RQC03143.1 histidine kinase [Pseudomonas aeruginosa]